MSFVVREISRTADGREIIRSRTLDAREITIGRATESDIHLPDLAVTLAHAVLRTLGGGRLEVEAIAGLPFDVTGRSTERAELTVARGATIKIGSHLLTIAPGETDEEGRPIITIDRVGEISDASGSKDEDKVFSLAWVAPGKRKTAWTLAILLLLAFLAWPLYSFMSDDEAAGQGERRPIAFHADEMWSSGKLSQVHANLENNCQACHQKPGVAVRDESCATCHSGIHDHADKARLAAAKLAPGAGGQVQLAVSNAFNRPEGRCVDCHTEHEGAKAMPTTAQKFCSDCHTGLNERLTDTKILNAGDFGTDHPQFRPLIWTNPARPVGQRLSLDARPLEDSGLKFPHDIHLSKTNGIGRMAATLAPEFGFGKQGLECANCHVPDAAGTRFVKIDMERNCQMCHDLAYDQIGGTVRTLRHGRSDQVVADIRAVYRSTGASRPINLGGMSRRRPGDFAEAATFADYRLANAQRAASANSAVRSVFSEGGACFDCHQVTPPSAPGAVDFGIVPVRLADRYMAKGWFDHKAHATETCASCHAAPTSKSASDVLLPKIDSCRECHGGEKASKQVPSSCAICHDYHMDNGAPLMVRDSRTRGKRTQSTTEPRAAG